MRYLRLFLLFTFSWPVLTASAGPARPAGDQQRTDSTNAFTPTKVHLQAKATPLVEVVHDLARQSKISLSLDCEPRDLGERPVTLDTGETSFWKALDALCRQAKIHLRPNVQALAPGASPKAKQAIRQKYPLVLQDGVLPEQPVAYLGCVRVRLLPDPSYDAKDGTNGEQWLAEVLSEPKVQWQGPLFLSWQEPRGSGGEPVGAAPVVVRNSVKDMEKKDGESVKVVNVIKIIPGAGLMNDALPHILGFDPTFNQDKISAVLRQEIPVSWTTPAGVAGQAVTWQGRLRGEFLLPPAAVVTVAEMLKVDGKRIECKDGSGLTVKKAERKLDGKVEMEIEIHASQNQASSQQAGKEDDGVRIIGQKVVNELSDGGTDPVVGKTLGIYAWDTKGRKYGIAATRISANDHACSYRLILKPPAKDSVPAKLERHAPYPVKFDQSFTLHIELRTASTSALAPTKVHLQAKATPLAEVVRDLIRQSKIPLFLDQEPVELRKRDVTLDTGETSFWEALDALCRQAKIHLRPEARTLGPTGGLNAAEAIREKYPLVLQDGVPPESPVAYSGCIRVRLRPDPFRLDEGVRTDQWIVEVLSEPRLQWRGPLSLSLEEPRGSRGEKVGAAPVIIENATKDVEVDREAIPGAMHRVQVPGGFFDGVVVGWPAGVRPFESNSQNKEPTIFRQQYPLTWTLPTGAAGQPITMQGKLKGGALLPSATVITVAEVLKTGGKRIEGKDGFGLTVEQCKRKDDGTVEMQVKVETEKRLVMKTLVSQFAGVEPIVDVGGSNVSGLKRFVEGKSIGLYVWDTKGRQYTVTANIVSAKDGIATYRLSLKPPAKDSEPGKLERHAPYSFQINQTFTLHNIHRD